MIKRLSLISIALLTSGFSRFAIAGELVCNSPDGEYHHCNLADADKLKVKLKYRSDGDCKKGDTWGVDNKGVWVEGCQATFRFKDANNIQNSSWKRFLPSWVR